MPIHKLFKTKDNKAAGEVRSMKPLKHSDLNNRSSALKTPASQQKKISSFFTSTPKSAGNVTPRESNGADGTPEPARQPSKNLCEQSTPNGAPVAAEATTPPPLAAAASVPSAAAPAPPPSIGAEVVGRRIKVFWPQEGTWFEGSISRYDQDKGKHRVSYDDGDKEWVVLSAEQYELLADKAVSKAAPHAAGAGAGAGGVGEDMDCDKQQQQQQQQQEEEQVVKAGQRRRRLGGSGKHGAAGDKKAAGGRLRRVVMSDDDDAAPPHGSDSDSEFSADGEADDSDSGLDELEDEEDSQAGGEGAEEED
ncbi:hypothetical protein V8C86DRAFT_3140857, partial [Haematococcus lacustris]